MELTGLTHKEQIALVALMEAVAIADRQMTEGEERQIGRVVVALGEENYRDLHDDAETSCPTLDQLKTYLGSIENQESRELIYGTVLEEALSEPCADHAQFDLMAWLAKEWQIDVEIVPEDS